MKKNEIVRSIEDRITRNAYHARVFEELYGLGFDVSMMEYERDVTIGKAFGCMEILSEITGKASDDIYEAAVEKAIIDIRKTNYNVVALLKLVNYNAEAYYQLAIDQGRYNAPARSEGQ